MIRCALTIAALTVLGIGCGSSDLQAPPTGGIRTDTTPDSGEPSSTDSDTGGGETSLVSDCAVPGLFAYAGVTAARACPTPPTGSATWPTPGPGGPWCGASSTTKPCPSWS